jgi:hypothetical protein
MVAGAFQYSEAIGDLPLSRYIAQRVALKTRSFVGAHGVRRLEVVRDGAAVCALGTRAPGERS